MTASLVPARMWALVLAMFGLMTLAVPVGAQQRNPDGSLNPTASAVKEQELLKKLQEIEGFTSLPDVKTGVLEQPYGRDWRRFNQVTTRWVAAIAILGMLAVLVLFYLIRGTVRIEGGLSGRTLVRFDAFERFVHWMTASCFIVLAISGLNITFGRELLIPLIGAEAFAAWSQWAKYAHNFLSFPFTLGVVLMVLMWATWNIPSRGDVRWIEDGGGMIGKKHPPAERFNAGQKAIYWVVVLGGGAAAVTGYILMFPFYGTAIAGMQLAQMVHAIVGALFIAIMLAHIYIGTIGMQGAFEAMGTGEVDVNWALQHHSLWFAKEQQRNRPSGSSVEPAE